MTQCGLTAWTFNTVQHPVSILDGVKCVNLQVQSGGLSSATVLVPEALVLLGASNGGFAARRIDKIFEGLVESGTKRNAVTLVE
jgi:hypothetical protein